MKVRELIEELQKLDPELQVYTYDSSYWWCEVDSAVVVDDIRDYSQLPPIVTKGVRID